MERVINLFKTGMMLDYQVRLDVLIGQAKFVLLLEQSKGKWIISGIIPNSRAHRFYAWRFVRRVDDIPKTIKRVIKLCLGIVPDKVFIDEVSYG